ncbi:MAG: acyl-[ACP]--phospholipid O-acyltransferase [Trichlorobacter sp.]|jgi:acyl-[acyl-carrier-protein]-phospholipid O-acyltransferase/long-chain-fatty-acid--[acyl-carrier-protein] ligase
MSKLPAGLTALNATQFLGAMNDNILKLLIIFSLIQFQGGERAGIITATAGACFVLPFLLFSAPAGCLADRFSKARVSVAVKLLEVLVTALAVGAFALRLEGALYLVLFLMATHSALFAPAKYGIIPELAPRDELSRANGLIESFTFLAIIFGTTLASALTQVVSGRFWLAACFCLAIAIIGLISALQLPKVAPAAPNRAIHIFPAEIFRTMRQVAHDRWLMLAIIGLAWFMLVGAFTQLNLIGYGIQQLGLNEAQSGYLFLASAFGIGSGALLAARLSGRDVEFGIVPLGAIGLTLAPILLHNAPAHLPTVLAIILLFGISAGLFSLPLQTFIQMRADADMRGEVLAASSFINWVGILIASGLTFLFSGPLKLSAAQGFSIMGVMTLVLTLLTLRYLPDFLLRFVALAVMNLLYRIRVDGRENVPLDGPALLVANHVSWIDALLLIATQTRRIRFVMDRSIYDSPALNPLFRLMGMIPVSARDGVAGFKEFMRTTRQVLDEGYLVCIFAEGEITRHGSLNAFRPGFARIAQASGVPIIPAYIGGAWGNIFSYARNRRLYLQRYPMHILFGQPLAAEQTARVRTAVMELSVRYYEARKAQRLPLADAFVNTARSNWRQPAVNDTTGKGVTYGRLLTGALLVKDRLKPVLSGDNVGVLLPPSVAGFTANIALTLLGRVPVNLNYTASKEAFASSLEQAGISCVVTSKKVLERLPDLAMPERIILLEELMTGLGAFEKLKALTAGRLAPRAALCESRPSPDDTATIIFSSGSTGSPKGVMLSHHNILSNIESLRAVFQPDQHDRVAAVLPLFHSLGFTGTLWLPLLSGFSAACHSNPLEATQVIKLVRNEKASILITTPTFLSAYLRKADPVDFKSLRLVITGAEKLKSELANAFEEKFGLRPLEGYGATELSPVISLNIPDVEIGGIRQKGHLPGSVGRPIPGVAIRIVDPESSELLADGQPGLIEVAGPNLMTGYLGRPEETARVIRNGWYNTGDIGCINDEGFVVITDRLARFSKIAGEMIPHGAVEERLLTALASTDLLLAVTAVPDEKKGERIAVVFDQTQLDQARVKQAIEQADLPNLWKPSLLVAAEAIPLLGSGKLDLKGLKKLAEAAA